MARKSVELKAHKDDKVKISEGILEASGPDKPMTDEQRKLLDSLMVDIKQLNRDIEAAEFVEDQIANRDTQSRKVPPAEVRNEGAGARVQIVNQMRPAKLRAFTGVDAEQNAYRAGMWAVATLWNNSKAKQWCKDHGMPMILNAAVEGDDAKGGFLVPDVMERAVIDLREQYGVFRQLARIRPMSSDFMTVPRRAGGLTAYALGEAADFTVSDKSWSAVNLTARKWGVLAKYSSEIAEDAIISIADDLASEIAYAFAVAEDGAGFNGDGTSTYHGITGVVTKMQAVIGAGQLAGAVDAATNHDTFAEIDATDLTTVMAKLPLYASMRPDCAWICSQPAWSLVFQRLQAAAGGNTKTDVAGKMIDSYLGYPVIKSQAMPTSTGDLSDKVMLFFGSVSAAISMGTRRGVTLAVSMDRYFESDQIGIRGIERFDINVHDIGDATTAGPLVALIGE